MNLSEKKNGVLGKLYIALIFLFLFAPIAVLIFFSFNQSKSRSVFTGFTLNWYREMLRDYVAAWGGSEETAREVDPYESYEFFSYNSLASDIFEDIVRKAFFKEDN